MGNFCCFIAKTPEEHEICNITVVADASNLKTKSTTNLDKKKMPHQVKTRDRLFSEDTLNYVVEGIDAVEISPKPYNDDKEEEKEEKKGEEASEADVFKSLHQTTEAKKLSSSASFVDEGSFDLVNSSLPSQTPEASSTTTSLRPRQVSDDQKKKMIGNLPSTPNETTMASRISFTKPSPHLNGGGGIFTAPRNAFQMHGTPTTASCSLLQMEGATSTPISDKGYPLPKPKMSPFESLRSPLTSNTVVMVPPLPPPVSNDLISRKGGKNWRRSVNVAAAAGKFSSPNRRDTINYQTLVSEKVEIFGRVEGVNFHLCCSIEMSFKGE